MCRPATTTALLVTLAAAAPAAADERPRPPYYASIAAGAARMRTGPARNYPASWLYRRADLPVRVVTVFKEWRQVEDPDGARGWMLATLLSARRTLIVRGSEPLAMRDAPSDDARLRWRAAPGVVGRVGDCANGWCRLEVGGRTGFVHLGGQVWGVEADETID